MKLIFLFLFLSIPAYAQYSGRGSGRSGVKAKNSCSCELSLGTYIGDLQLVDTSPGRGRLSESACKRRCKSSYSKSKVESIAAKKDMCWAKAYNVSANLGSSVVSVSGGKISVKCSGRTEPDTSPGKKAGRKWRQGSSRAFKGR